MDNNLVVNASIVALIIRLLAVPLFVVVIYRQWRQFKTKSNLQSLKRLLIALVVMIAFSNLPIIKLHLDRISAAGHSTPEVTAIATTANAASMLIIAILLYLIYGFKEKD